MHSIPNSSIPSSFTSEFEGSLGSSDQKSRSSHHLHYQSLHQMLLEAGSVSARDVGQRLL